MTVILFATLLGGVILTGYYYYYFNAIPKIQVQEQHLPFEPVTVLICVKNGLPSIQSNLEGWCSQDYPEYEVVIIDDHSTDGLTPYLRQVQSQYPKLRFFPAPEEIRDAPGKKAALQYGFQHAKHPWILMTDADCRPASSYWIREMMNARTRKTTQCILGYCPFERTPSLLSRWMAFETAWVALQYLGFARRGEAYMGVGRNLLVKRDAASTADLHPEIASGDDDFLVQSIRPDKIEICIREASWVMTDPPSGWNAWWKRKTRHSQASVQYPLRIQVQLLILTGSLILLYGGILVLTGLVPIWKVLIIVLGFTMTVLPVRWKLMRLLDIPRFTWWWAEPLLLFTYGLVGIRMLFRQKTSWN